mgnify:CR=1 FL=1
MSQSAIVELYESQDWRLWEKAGREALDIVTSTRPFRAPYGYLTAMVLWVGALVFTFGFSMLGVWLGSDTNVIAELAGPVLVLVLLASLACAGLTSMSVSFTRMKWYLPALMMFGVLGYLPVVLLPEGGVVMNSLISAFEIGLGLGTPASVVLSIFVVLLYAGVAMGGLMNLVGGLVIFPLRWAIWYSRTLDEPIEP